MDFRDYLRDHRDPLVLPLILKQLAEGIAQLHGLGFSHRDLRPEIIVLNLDPLQVKITDFTASYPSSQKSKGTIRGALGYFPDQSKWLDGSYAWDLYSFGVLVLEADMKMD
jgi:serine/threonine protein kinase